MKTISPFAAIIGAALIFSASVQAGHGGHHGGHDRGGRYDAPRHVKMAYNHPSRHHNGNWIVPLVIGGALGYILSEPRRESVTYVQSVHAPVVYAPQPLYQEQWVYFSECDCQRKVLVPVR